MTVAVLRFDSGGGASARAGLSAFAESRWGRRSIQVYPPPLEG